MFDMSSINNNEKNFKSDEDLNIESFDLTEEDFIPNLRKSLKRDKIAKDNQRNRWKIKNVS